MSVATTFSNGATAAAAECTATQWSGAYASSAWTAAAATGTVVNTNVSQAFAATDNVPSFTGSTDVWFLFSDVSDDQPTWDTTTTYTDTEGTLAISSHYLDGAAASTATTMAAVVDAANVCTDSATTGSEVTCTVLIAGAASLVAASLVASAALAF